jgi:glutaredoxin
MPLRILLFTQAGCLSCELMKIFLEAKEIVFEERDMNLDSTARMELLEIYHTHTAPAIVILKGTAFEVIEGFDPARLDRCLAAA